MIELPPKGQEVSLEEIMNICAEYNLKNLWYKIEQDPPKKPFKSDGCSWWPDTWNSFNLYPACFLHDLKYWNGGDKIDRLIADAELMIDIVKITNDINLAQVMFAGVRTGGGPHFKKSFSWNFGRE